MCGSEEFKQETKASLTAEKASFVMGQIRLLTDSIKLGGHPVIRCGCQKKVPIMHAFRCLYCGEWYCQTCAEDHFGMTREEWARDQSDLDLVALDAEIAAVVI